MESTSFNLQHDYGQCLFLDTQKRNVRIRMDISDYKVNERGKLSLNNIDSRVKFQHPFDVANT